MIIRFDGCEVDLARVEIRREGELIDVQPQVFTVIEYLIENRDRVVTKEELLDNIWGDRFVSESTLTSRIKSGRQALGDDGTTQRIIRTVHGRGYRFVADVVVEDGPDGIRRADAGSDADADSDDGVDTATSVPADVQRTPELGDGDGSWPFTGRREHLESIAQWYDGGDVAGVIVRGPSGVGTTRLAIESQRSAHAAGVPTSAVIGSPATSDIPLAAMGHLLDGDALDVDAADNDFARAAAFRRVRQAVTSLAGSKRPFLVVDGVDQLDSTTVAVLQSAMADKSAFCVIAMSDGDEASAPASAFASQVSAGHLRTITLEALSESDIDVLLYRALPGPIDAGTLTRLASASQGRPAALRDIVETSIAHGSLVDDHGVWRLVGSPVSSALSTWEPGRLSVRARDAAERLALVPLLPQRVAVEWLGEDAIDELDAARLLELRRGEYAGQPTWRLSLRDPLLTSRVIDDLPPLRALDLRAEMAERVAGADVDIPMLAAVVSWGEPFVRRIDPGVVVSSAQAALFNGDFDSAEVLIDGLVGDEDDPQISILRGELALRRGQWGVAERAFDDADIDSVDGRTAAHVLRRRASISFYARARHIETIDVLDAESTRFGGRVAEALRARRAAMLAYLGSARDVLAMTDGFEEHDGITSIETLLARATGLHLQGRTSDSLDIVGRLERRVATLPDVWVDELRDGLLATTCAAMMSHGDVTEASVLVRRHLPVGRRTMLGMLPSLAALVELRVGRPLAALEIVRPVVASSHRDDFPQYRTIARAVDLVIRSQLSGDSAPEAEWHDVLDDSTALTGELRWLTLMSLASILPRSAADAAPLLDEVARDARAAGAIVREAEAIALAVTMDVASAPSESLARLDDLVSSFDGTFWPVRAMHVRSVVDGDLEGVERAARAYAELGYHGLVNDVSLASSR